MKTLVVDAIVGVGFPSDQLAVQCEMAGLALYTGTKKKASWMWVRKALERCELEQLQELYQGLREERDAAPVAPVVEAAGRIALQ